MTIGEASKILTIMEISYPNFHPYDRKLAAEIWHRMLSDYPYEAVDAALQAYIRSNTSGFAPSIGQIMALLKSREDESQLSPERAWQLYRAAICNGYYNAEEEYNKLPELVKKTIGGPDSIRTLATTKLENLDSVEKSHFLRQYRAVAEREKVQNRIPLEVRAKLGIGTEPAKITEGVRENDFYLQG